MQPAARLGDMHACPQVTPGTPPVPHVGGPVVSPGCTTVLIGGPFAARVTDMATCVGPPDSIVAGSPTVYTGGPMQARIGDPTAHGGVIVQGLPTVLVGGPTATVATVGGVMTVTWGGMTIEGSPADVAFFLEMIAQESSRSDTVRQLFARVTTDTANPTTFNLVRGDPTVWVDAYNGNGDQTVNLDYFDSGEFPEDPSATHPDTCTRGENLVHAVDEAHQGAVLQNTNGNDPAGANWYNESHAHAIDTENDYRTDRGQASQLQSSSGGPGPDDVTFQYDNGASEIHDQNTGNVTHLDPSGNPIP